MGTNPAFSYSSGEITCCLDPLARAVRALHKSGETVIVGIQGGQGTGKTTLVKYLAKRLSDEGSRVVSFSIDDFYTSYDDRKHLASKYTDNPFYQLPRGMPGTHRVGELLAALSCLKSGDDAELPVFDKSAHQGNGDISAHVVAVKGRQDFVLFEGWCVAMPEATPDEMVKACRRQGLSDSQPLPEPVHLGAVLSRLGPYQPAWGLIDFLVMLCPDSPDLHLRWRLEQEKELIAATGAGMSDEQVSTMVQHVLPFTCLCNEKIVPDLRICISKDHTLYKVIPPKSEK
jgi:D-glycerate 3-kinase